MAKNSEHLIQWSVAASPLSGETVCGDSHFAHQSPRGSLFAVIDGLGHGLEAAEAASAATTVLEGNCGESLPELVRRCHRAEYGLRGVVMSLLRIDLRRQQMDWLGIGNVTGTMFRSKAARAEHLLVRPGIVGANLPALHVLTLPIESGDVIFLATDGVNLSGLGPATFRFSHEHSANRLLEMAKTGKDDALVMVVRLGGDTP